mmetsp:Transcript_26888/g.65285  ORF Transcript_26888/g.65285 Transcript_26888/m.65285 type:complete len:204 (+) Transcript_26888:1236-1847(+)
MCIVIAIIIYIRYRSSQLCLCFSRAIVREVRLSRKLVSLGAQMPAALLTKLGAQSQSTLTISTSTKKEASAGISFFPSAYPRSAGTSILRSPPFFIPLSASCTKITSGGGARSSPLYRPPLLAGPFFTFLVTSFLNGRFATVTSFCSLSSLDTLRSTRIFASPLPPSSMLLISCFDRPSTGFPSTAITSSKIFSPLPSAAESL